MGAADLMTGFRPVIGVDDATICLGEACAGNLTSGRKTPLRSSNPVVARSGNFARHCRSLHFEES